MYLQGCKMQQKENMVMIATMEQLVQYQDFVILRMNGNQVKKTFIDLLMTN